MHPLPQGMDEIALVALRENLDTSSLVMIILDTSSLVMIIYIF
jgi:hypothetical protein